MWKLISNPSASAYFVFSSWPMGILISVMADSWLVECVEKNNYFSNGNFENDLMPWLSRIDYFENNKQNLSSHLELVISENSQFFACYLSIDFYNKHRRSRPWKVFLGYCALYLPFLTRCSLLRFFLALWQLNGEIKSLFIHWIRFLIGDLQYLFLNSLYMAE